MRAYVQSPGSIRSLETRFGVPARIAGIATTGKPGWKRAQARSRKPPSRAHQLVKRGMQPWHVHCFSKRFLPVIAQTYHWLRPRCWVMRIAPRITPQLFAAFIRQFSRETVIETDKAVRYELPYLRRIEGRQLVMVGSWHTRRLQGVISFSPDSSATE